MLYTKKKIKPGLIHDDSVDIPNEISSIDAEKDQRTGHTGQETLISKTNSDATTFAGDEAALKARTNLSVSDARPESLSLEKDEAIHTKVLDDPGENDVEKADSDKASTIYEEVSVR